MTNHHGDLPPTIDQLITAAEELHQEYAGIPDVGKRLHDGLPTAAELIAAAELLHIPVNREEIGLANMTPERRLTVLLAILAVWLNAYQVFVDFNVERLDSEELAMLVSSAESEANDGDPVITMNLAIWRLQWTGYVMAEVGRTPNEANPTDVITDLIRAALLMITSWRESHGDVDVAVVDNEGVTHYGLGNRELVEKARKDVVDALSGINRLLGGPSSAAP